MNDVVYDILVSRKPSNEYVFTTQKGNMLHQDHLREKLQRVCKKLAIRNVNLHISRRTCVSDLVMAGVDLPTVVKILGIQILRRP